MIARRIGVLAMAVAAALAGQAAGDQTTHRDTPKHGMGQKMVVSQDANELAEHIEVPSGVTEVFWSSDRSPGGRDWVLNALLVMEPGARDTFLETLPRGQGIAVTAPDWLPQRYANAELAEETRIDATSLAKSPLNIGAATPVGDDAVLLFFTTM